MQCFHGKSKLKNRKVLQIENKRSCEYQQTTPDPPLLNRHTDGQRIENILVKKGLKIQIQKFTGVFQEQANLNSGRVAGYYYNAHTKVAFKNPPGNQNLESGSSLLNQRIQDYDQLLSSTP